MEKYYCFKEIHVNIVNCTPHNVSIYNDHMEKIMELIPCGITSRIALSEQKIIGMINEIIPITVNTYGDAIDLPSPKENTIFIVSKMVAEAMKGIRNDLYIVNDSVRDENNRIIGCKSLAQLR